MHVCADKPLNNKRWGGNTSRKDYRKWFGTDHGKIKWECRGAKNQSSRWIYTKCAATHPNTGFILVTLGRYAFLKWRPFCLPGLTQSGYRWCPAKHTSVQVLVHAHRVVWKDSRVEKNHVDLLQAFENHVRQVLNTTKQYFRKNTAFVERSYLHVCRCICSGTSSQGC